MSFPQFCLAVAYRLIDWVLDDPAPRAAIALFLSIPLGIAAWLLRSNSIQPKGKGRHTTGQPPAQRRSRRLPWGRWLGATALLLGVTATGGILADAYRVVSVARGLSWQASELYRANCAGINASRLTKQPVSGMETLMPTYRRYSWRLQQVMFIVGHHELAQKGIIKDRPVPTYSDEASWQIVAETSPPSIDPTPFGRRVCTYFLGE